MDTRQGKATWTRRRWLAAALLTALAPTMAQGQGVVDTSVAVLDTLVKQPDSIPPSLLASAHGVAIIPGLVKGGFIVGVHKGKGLIVTRDKNGNWQPPSMITLTGGSIGWQAGIQSTDLVLIFKNRRSVANLMDGKLTIGVDAAAAAGPVGRKASAATDGKLAAEIYSYSRSRGLFAGVSVDGATLNIDHNAQRKYYASAPQGAVPQSTAVLLDRLNKYSGRPRAAARPMAQPAQPRAAAAAGQLAQQLAVSQGQLQGMLDDTWSKYLAVSIGGPAQLPSLRASLQRYDQVASDARYASLTQRPDFRRTHELLRQYVAAVASAAPGELQLPPPPAGR